MGHYLVGRWCGIGVKAFSVGFGPEIAGFTDRHGTRWKLSAIPLGGYVKFLGDMTATSAQADDAEMARLSPDELGRAFHTQPVWKRFLTVLAGPVANFILTIAVFAVMFASYGRFVADPLVGEVTPGSPAAVAGFEPGDRFVSMDGTKITDFSDIQRHVGARGGDPITFVVERDGREVELVVTPLMQDSTDPLGNKIKRAMIGIAADISPENARRVEMDIGESFTTAVSETGFIIGQTGHFFKRLVMGREDKCQLGGPVKIADMAGKAAKKGFDWLVQLVALLSVGIGILNLLPVPPLDGGHLMFYAIEAIQGRPVSERAMEAVYRAGFLLVLAFMGFVFWNDLFGC
ncbi:MAG: RIP metalloprotease RseP [Notoacmeibacter sp.]|nr:RIP metalloprotease RseP [Notoacmeibacter sp.]